MRVVKFGGTSVGNAERMRGVAAIVEQQAREGPLLVVVSAVGGVTDTLLRGASEAAAGRSAV
ncbi:MAG TPA: aspartate kinase, partial [Thermoanaerobaculia bacterium]